LKNGIINLDDLTKKLVSFFQDNSIINNPIGNTGDYKKIMKGVIFNKKSTFNSLVEYLCNNNILKQDESGNYVSGKTFHSNVLDKNEFNKKFIEDL